MPLATILPAAAPWVSRILVNRRFRLVNVPANPSGRCGAPETEPGPSGVEDELIRIPFHK